MDEINYKLTQYEQVNSKLEYRSSTLKKYADALVKERSSLESQKDSLEQELNDFKQRSSLDFYKLGEEVKNSQKITELTSENAELGNQVKGLQGIVDDLQQNVDVLRHHVADLENQIAESDNKNEEMNELLLITQTNIADLQETIRTLETQKLKLSQQNELLILTVKDKTNKLETIKAECKEMNQKNLALEKSLENLKKLVGAIAKEKSNSDSRLSNLEDKLNSSESANLSRSDSIEVFNRSNTISFETIDPIQVRPSLSQQQNFNIDFMPSFIERTSEGNRSLELENMLARISEIEAKNSDLETEKLKLFKKNEVLSTQLKDKLKQVQSLTVQSNHYKEENDKLDSRSQALKKYLDVVNKEKIRLENSLKKPEEENSASNQRFSLQTVQAPNQESDYVRFSLDSLMTQNTKSQSEIPKDRESLINETSEIIFEVSNCKSEITYQDESDISIENSSQIIDIKQSDLDEKLKLLEAENRRLSQVNLLLTSQLKDKLSKLDSLQQELRNSYENTQKQEIRSASIKKYNEALVTQNSDLRKNIEDLQSENTNLRHDLSMTQNTHSLQAEITNLKSQLEILTAEKNDITNSYEIRINKLSETNTILASQIRAKISRFEILTSDYKNSQEENMNLNSRVDTLKKFNDALVIEKAKLQSNYDSLKEKPYKNEETIPRSSVDETQSRSSLESSLIKHTEDDYRSFIDDLESQIKTHIQEKSELKAEIGKLCSQVDSQNELLRQQNKILDNEKTKLCQINGLLKSQLNDKIAKNEQLNSKLHDLEAENESLNTRVTNMKRFIDALAKEKSILTTRIERLEESNSELKSQITDISNENQSLLFELSEASISDRNSLSSNIYSAFSNRNSTISQRNSYISHRNSIFSLRGSMQSQRNSIMSDLLDFTTEKDSKNEADILKNQVLMLTNEKENLEALLNLKTESHQKYLQELSLVLPNEYYNFDLKHSIKAMSNEILEYRNLINSFQLLISQIEAEIPDDLKEMNLIEAIKALAEDYKDNRMIRTKSHPDLEPLSPSEIVNSELSPSDMAQIYISTEEAQCLYATLKKIEEENQEVEEARRGLEQENIILREKMRQTERQTLIMGSDGIGASLLDLKMLVISLGDMIGPQRTEIEACYKEILILLGMSSEEISQIEDRRLRSREMVEKTSKFKKLFSSNKKK